MAENGKVPPTTAAQKAALKAQEDAWEEERTWPIWEVKIAGDNAEWVARPDERYWRQADPNDPNTKWIPKLENDLPKEASLHPETGQVVMKRRGTVQMHARNEDHAKMLALRDNPEYHTIESVKKLKGK